MSRNDEENAEEAFCESPPAVSRSNSTSTGESDSGSKLTHSVSRTRTDSGGSGTDADGELESAESSAVSFSDGGPQGDSLQAEEGTTPSMSPLVLEVPTTGKFFGRTSPAVRHLSTDTPPSPLFFPKNPFLDLGGKITKFKWTPSHINLLEELLLSISDSVENRKR